MPPTHAVASSVEDFGADLVIDTDKGPMIMEIDVPPGLDIENVTKQGLRRILDDA